MAIPKKVVNFCYGMGASVVLVGALFKITHMELGPLNGNNMLTVGLLVEAFIFAMSAFEPVDEEVDWSRVYPELKGGEPRAMQVAGNVGVTGTVATTSVGATQQQPVQVQAAKPAYAATQVASQPAVAVQQPTMERGLLSEKLDNILREAKIDGNLMESLRDSIKNFEAAAKGIAPTVETVASSNRYAEEMARAAQQLETLNSMYKTQLE